MTSRSLRHGAAGAPWKGRRVAVVGLGRSGQAAARLLCRAGCRVSVTDAGRHAALEEAGVALRAQGVETVELGGHTEALIERSDLVVVSPGLAELVAPIQWAARRGLPIISEIELAFRFCPASVVAVTGTNGKSSVVTMLAQVVRATGRPAIACGNLGLPFSAVIDQLTPQSLAVVEVSSFQLIRCDTFRPAIGVLLNLGTNHLDRHGQREAYIQAKARLFQQQTARDWAVFNGRDPLVAGLAKGVRAQVVWFGENRTNPPWARLSEHTQTALGDNAQAVLQTCRILGVPDPLTWQVIRTFRGLEHRREPVGRIHGVTYVNDSKSTTPDSLVFALQQARGPLVVILGGRDKGLDFEPLAMVLREERIRGIVLIGESRARLRLVLGPSEKLREASTLEAAIREAMALAHPGDTVLFSPACASFDMFRDFEERGRAFKAIVHRLNGTDPSPVDWRLARPGPSQGRAGEAGGSRQEDEPRAANHEPGALSYR